MSDIFEDLRNTFNIDEEVKKVDDLCEKTKEFIDDVTEGMKAQKYNVDDVDFIKTELKTLIVTNQTVLTDLSGQLKMGAPPHMYDVFMNGSQRVSGMIMDLFKVMKQITDYRVVESNEEFKNKAMEQKERLAQARIAKSGTTNTQINAYCTDSKSTLEMIQGMISKAQSESRQLEDKSPEFNLE